MFYGMGNIYYLIIDDYLFGKFNMVEYIVYFVIIII